MSAVLNIHASVSGVGGLQQAAAAISAAYQLSIHWLSICAPAQPARRVGVATE